MVCAVPAAHIVSILKETNFGPRIYLILIYILDF